MDLKKLWTESKWLNGTTKPILFITILIVLIGMFGYELMQMDYITQFILIGLPLSLIIFYYFGKVYDGWLYLLSLLLVNWSWDLVMPPYSVDPSGTINQSIYMVGTSVDYFIATTLQNIGFSGYMLYVITYVIGFAILFTLGLTLAKMSKKRKQK